MKKVLIGVGILIILIVASMPLLRNYTKSHSPEDQAVYNGSMINVTVDYCQPSKKNRLIFGAKEEGALVPFGEKWRTGANEATEIEFSADALVGGQSLDQGRYSMYTIPGKDNWTVVFNSNTDYWGINPFGETFDESKDVIRVEVPVINSIDETEMFTIEFEEIMDNNAVMVMKWDKTSINVPISMK